MLLSMHSMLALGFEGVEAASTGRPSYHHSVLLKLYIYGYLNRVQSSRRLERAADHNVELRWLQALAIVGPAVEEISSVEPSAR